MATPSFRRKKGADHVWHFSANCGNWPTRDFDSRIMAGEPLCDHCQYLVLTGISDRAYWSPVDDFGGPPALRSA
jgi:hypothetical protein